MGIPPYTLCQVMLSRKKPRQAKIIACWCGLTRVQLSAVRFILWSKPMVFCRRRNIEAIGLGLEVQAPYFQFCERHMRHTASPADEAMSRLVAQTECKQIYLGHESTRLTSTQGRIYSK